MTPENRKDDRIEQKAGATSAQARSHKYKGEDLNTALPESKTTSTSFMNNLTQHSQEAAQALAEPNIIKGATERH